MTEPSDESRPGEVTVFINGEVHRIPDDFGHTAVELLEVAGFNPDDYRLYRHPAKPSGGTPLREKRGPVSPSDGAEYIALRTEVRYSDVI